MTKKGIPILGDKISGALRYRPLDLIDSKSVASKHSTFLLSPWFCRNINQVGDLPSRDFLFHYHALDVHWSKIGDPDLAADMSIGELCIGREIADRVYFAGFQFLPPFPGTGQGAQDNEKARSITIAENHYAAFDHGYACTIHKSQGATVDNAYVLGSSTMDHHLSYVAMTRHRHEMLNGVLNSIDRGSNTRPSLP